MGFQDLKKTIQEHFPIEREQTETEFNSDNEFLVNRSLYKKAYYNDYCAVRLRKDYCLIDFFKSDARHLDEIESDWADYSFTFKIEEKDYATAERFFSWLV